MMIYLKIKKMKIKYSNIPESPLYFDRSNMFVHPILPKLQTYQMWFNNNQEVINREQHISHFLYWCWAVTLFYTNTWIINFKWKILSISPMKLPAQTSAYAEEKCCKNVANYLCFSLLYHYFIHTYSKW